MWLKLLVAFALLTITSACFFDRQCPRYGDCKWGECRCKYGVKARDSSGKVSECEAPVGFPMKVPLVVGMILFVVFMGVAVWVICYIRKKRLARSMTQAPMLWGAQNPPPQSGPVPQGYPPPQAYPSQPGYPPQQPGYPQPGYPAQQPYQPPGYPPPATNQGGPQPYGFTYNQQDQPPPYNQATGGYQYGPPH